MDDTSSPSSGVESVLSEANDMTSAPSSPPPAASPPPDHDAQFTEDSLLKEEREARAENRRAEQDKRAAAAAGQRGRASNNNNKKKKKKKKAETRAEHEAKARELDALLMKSAAFSDILTKKTQVLGRVGSSLDGKTLGEHHLNMAKQPKCMVGGTMRDYQLEGLTWMFEICSQGMSGILADEMGLGKTVQTIALIALLREQENYLGPHLIVAPLSTLSNWMDEFHKWTPSIPAVMYHGDRAQRQDIFQTKLMANLQAGRPSPRFPVVCTSYEMVLRDQHNLSRIQWEFIIIDEGHRMKNADAKLFQQLRQFSSATRLLITGTPLQNNLKELWSLLHFLLPNIFTDWEAFESWFDFSDLGDEKRTEEFIADQVKQDLVRKMHLILQPLLLRRVKQDVAAYLPQKREYVLFAPMTKEQTDLYNAFTDKEVDTRAFLEQSIFDKINGAPTRVDDDDGDDKPPRASSTSERARRRSASKENTTSLPVRPSRRGKEAAESRAAAGCAGPAPNAFALMMGRRSLSHAQAARDDAPAAARKSKRKSPPAAVAPEPKSARSSRTSTPSSTRGRTTRRGRTYAEADSDEEALSDDAFEAKLARELGSNDDDDGDDGDEGDEADVLQTPAEVERAETLELAKKQLAHKKLGNPLAQLRLVCNSPHNFYNPWAASADVPVDESIVTSSGKMLLLDRLLPRLFRRGHKVLLFSQFKTQLDILEDYSRDLRGWRVCRIDGSVPQDRRRQQIHAFNTDPAHNLFLLSTRAGGQGINLASADTVILFDSDFNPQQDLQAQDRCHRIGQTRPVVVYRLATRGTVEESLLLCADAKRRLEKLVIRKGGFRAIMGQKLAARERVDEDALRALLLRDGQVYETSGGAHVLSDQDLDELCDRSDDAYRRAASGLGDADSYRVVETGADSIRMTRVD
ncbi:uncharacterized protein UV8b_01002 [Ustilaginoidea virens]|uniref:ISWI chromatin-remodeling complex ATPase ISW2 n=1 Tax=Ustilaginoidea virens TaxID=1159556 RepID=A0A8E5MEV0_USTVR|nr:uncharacterized protein UV8b_01002 [Ustilaginoidea virens]QUC16761.1 hypothetical protein UV8b_01002 [Ustilaginoidea virens]